MIAVAYLTVREDDVAFVQVFALAFGLSARLLSVKLAILRRAAICCQLDFDIANPACDSFIAFG